MSELEDIKHFLKSSQNMKGNLEKFYILRLVQNEKDFDVEDPPYKINIPVYSDIYILGQKILIPGLAKTLSVFNHKSNEIYSTLQSYNEQISMYVEDLYKILRLIHIIRSNIHRLEFWMMKQLYYILDRINLLISEYDYSIAIIGNEKLKVLIEKIKDEANNLDTLVSNRSSFIDSETSRLYTIMSIIALPLIFFAAWFGMNFDTKGQMLFTHYKYFYLIVALCSIGYVFLCFYVFSKDFLHLLQPQ